MDFTPITTEQQSHDSGIVSTSFSKSHIFESTPNDELFTPVIRETSRKRKYEYNCFNARKLTDLIESCPSTPQFSSTLNESLSNHLEKCHIEDQQPKKYFKGNNAVVEIKSAPSTPQKQIFGDEVRKPKSVNFFTTKLIEESPIREAHEILYANLKPVSARKTFSPFKLKESLEKFKSPAKKCLFKSKELYTQHLLSNIISNTVIMKTLFGYLSNGDLYRLAKVSSSLKDSIFQCSMARERFLNFTEIYKENKENYRITPPNSPHKSESPPNSPGSPNNRVFKEYCWMAKQIKSNQTLQKCPKCGKPSVVESSIGQCQNILSCGYIYCLKCQSFSTTGPDNFKDKCHSAVLDKNWRYLGDVSNNNTSDFFESSNISPTRNHNESSGFGSDNEQTPKVRRNLISSLCASEEHPTKPKIFSVNNRAEVTFHKKRRRSSIVVPVLSPPTPGTANLPMEPSSPPKVKNIACSKQSKRNLKRLTR